MSNDHTSDMNERFQRRQRADMLKTRHYLKALSELDYELSRMEQLPDHIKARLNKKK